MNNLNLLEQNFSYFLLSLTCPYMSLLYKNIIYSYIQICPELSELWFKLLKNLSICNLRYFLSKTKKKYVCCGVNKIQIQACPS